MQEAVTKEFTYYNPDVANGDTTIATVPAGWHAIIKSVFWKRTNTTMAIKFGATTVLAETLGDEVRMAGPSLAIGAAGANVLVTGGATADGVLAVSGIIVQDNIISRIPS